MITAYRKLLHVCKVDKYVKKVLAETPGDVEEVIIEKDFRRTESQCFFVELQQSDFSDGENISINLVSLLYTCSTSYLQTTGFLTASQLFASIF